MGFYPDGNTRQAIIARYHVDDMLAGRPPDEYQGSTSFAEGVDYPCYVIALPAWDSGHPGACIFFPHDHFV